MAEEIDSVEARKRSKGVRENILRSIASGEMTIDDVLNYALTKERDAEYAAGIRLNSILENLPGWSDAAANSVLAKNGFKQSDTIKTLRSAKIKAGKFKNLFELPPPSFASTRPEMPAGWPWQGKLADLVRVTGKTIPALEFEGFGDEDIKKIGEPRKRPTVAIPDLRANPQTGEIVDPQPFWESKKADVPEQPEDPSIDENDIAALFGEEASGQVDQKDIEELFS